MRDELKEEAARNSGLIERQARPAPAVYSRPSSRSHHFPLLRIHADSGPT